MEGEQPQRQQQEVVEEQGVRLLEIQREQVETEGRQEQQITTVVQEEERLEEIRVREMLEMQILLQQEEQVVQEVGVDKEEMVEVVETMPQQEL
jgi:hypothetical protein